MGCGPIAAPCASWLPALGSQLVCGAVAVRVLQEQGAYLRAQLGFSGLLPCPVVVVPACGGVYTLGRGGMYVFWTEFPGPWRGGAVGGGFGSVVGFWMCPRISLGPEGADLSVCRVSPLVSLGGGGALEWGSAGRYPLILAIQPLWWLPFTW